MCANYEQAKLIRQIKRRGVIANKAGEIYPAGTGKIVASIEPTELIEATFGLMPHWAKPALARSTYNARSETVGAKPSFRSAWRSRQFCVIPAQAIYEPNYETGQPVRWRIERADGESFGIAGLWERVMQGDQPSRWSFTMLTINATDHPLMNRFHGPDDEKRSVVVLDDDDWDAWLNCATESDARAMLMPFEPATMVASPAPRPPRQKTGT